MLRVALGGIHSSSATLFGLEAQAAGINFSSEIEVRAFVTNKIIFEKIEVENIRKHFTLAWNLHQERAQEIFQSTFETSWDLGEVTALLTLGQ